MMALSACLSGCSTGTSGSASASSGTQGTSSGESSDIIQLTYWYSWQDKIAENNVERIQEFNETVGKENGIQVTAEYQGTYDDLHSKLKSAFVANEEPDVCVMGDSQHETVCRRRHYTADSGDGGSGGRG